MSIEANEERATDKGIFFFRFDETYGGRGVVDARSAGDTAEIAAQIRSFDVEVKGCAILEVLGGEQEAIGRDEFSGGRALLAVDREGGRCAKLCVALVDGDKQGVSIADPLSVVAVDKP